MRRVVGPSTSKVASGVQFSLCTTVTWLIRVETYRVDLTLAYSFRCTWSWRYDLCACAWNLVYPSQCLGPSILLLGKIGHGEGEGYEGKKQEAMRPNIQHHEEHSESQAPYRLMGVYQQGPVPRV